METLENLSQKNVALEVTENSKNYLKTAAIWSKFIAILGFVGLAFLALGSIVLIPLGGILQEVMSLSFQFSLVGILYLVLAIVMFFPTLYMYRFSKKTTTALVMNNALELEDAFKNMKRYWKFIGIMTIVAIASCLIVVPIVMIAVIFSSGAFA